MKFPASIALMVLGPLAHAFAPPPPHSPDPNRVELGFPITRTDFAQNFESGTSAATCRLNEAMVGLAVRSGDVIDRIEIFCKDVNTLRDPAAPTERVYFGGGTGGTETILNAPLGYTLTAIEAQTCTYKGKPTIGTLRPIFRGASKWGMHTARIPGPWIGGECGKGKPSSPHDAGTDDPVSYVECTQNGGGLQHAMMGLVGSDSPDYVENLAGFCKPLLPIADKPKFNFWTYRYAGFVPAVPNAQETEDHQCNDPMFGYAVDARSPFYAQYGLWIEDVWRICTHPLVAQGYDAWFLAPPEYPDGFAPVDSKHKTAVYGCDDYYVQTGMFGWQDSDRLRDTGIVCTPIDLENAANTGTVTLPELSYSAGGFFNQDGRFFSVSCTPSQVMSGYEAYQTNFSLPQDPNHNYLGIAEFGGIYCIEPQVLFK